MQNFKKLMLVALAAGTLLVTGCASNATVKADSDDAGVKHKLVIQVSTDDPRTQKIALNNAVNVQKALGIDNVIVEIVAYGPGLSILTKKGKNAKRVASLAVQDIRFSACGNTMKKVARKKGKMPVLVEGVKVVQAGVLRIMELQEQGYSYIRP